MGFTEPGARREPDCEQLRIFPPLKDFRVLKILEIDQASLNVCLMRSLHPDMHEEEAIRQLAETPKKELFRQLPIALPSSLQTLGIYQLKVSRSQASPWSTLLLELGELASAKKKTTLPNLSVVQIDLDRCRPQETQSRLREAMKRLGMVSALKDAGIDLRFGLASFLPCERGMLPPLVGNIGSSYS